LKSEAGPDQPRTTIGFDQIVKREGLQRYGSAVGVREDQIAGDHSGSSWLQKFLHGTQQVIPRIRLHQTCPSIFLDNPPARTFIRISTGK